MPLPAELLRDLAGLTQALDRHDVDLATTVTRLSHDAQRAVPSYLGLLLLITVDGQDVVLHAFDDHLRPAAARTSLFMPLTASGSDERGSLPTVSIVLYAGTPGAFVDMNADFAWLDGSMGLVLDRHVPAPRQSDVADTLLALSTINQALGVLIARGDTPEQAEAELRGADATRRPAQRLGAAAGILAGLRDGSVVPGVADR